MCTNVTNVEILISFIYIKTHYSFSHQKTSLYQTRLKSLKNRKTCLQGKQKYFSSSESL